MSIQAKSALWFVMCSLLQRGISFITGPIFTRLMTTEQYGTYSLYLSWFQIMTILTSLYLSAGILTNAMNKYSGDRDRYISSMQGITITLTTICFIIYFIAHDMWNRIFGLDTSFMCLMFVELFVTPALAFWAGKQRYIYRYKSLVIVTLIKSFLNPVLGVFWVYFSNNKALARVNSIVSIELCFCGFFMILNFTRGKSFYHKKYWKYALGMAIPLIPHYLSGVILNQGDRIVIGQLCGKRDVALYSVAYTIGMLVQIFTDSIGNALSPWIYEHINTGEYLDMKKKLNYVLAFFWIVALGLMLLSPELILIFGSEKYKNAVYVIPPVAASTFFIYLYSLLSTMQFYFEKTKFMMLASVTAAGLNIILNYVFVTKFGYVAAGYTTLVCYILYCLGHHVVSHKIAHKYNNDRNVYDGKFVFFLSVLMIITCVIVNFIVNYPLIRYGIILCMVIIACLKKDLLIIYIKNFKGEEKYDK